MTLRIRPEAAADREASLEIERAAFGSDEEPRIVETVRDLDGSFALVAAEDGRVVGHIQFSRGRIGETRVLALGPVGVLPGQQGHGVGSALIRRGLEEARTRGEVAIILLGSPVLYRRFGFARAAFGSDEERRASRRFQDRGRGLHACGLRGGTPRGGCALASGVRRAG